MDEFKEQDKEYPTNVHNIPDNFFYLWLVKLPNQLLPMRNVQHAIYLIPDAPLQQNMLNWRGKLMNYLLKALFEKAWVLVEFLLY